MLETLRKVQTPASETNHAVDSLEGGSQDLCVRSGSSFLYLAKNRMVSQAGSKTLGHKEQDVWPPTLIWCKLIPAPGERFWHQEICQIRYSRILCQRLGKGKGWCRYCGLSHGILLRCLASHMASAVLTIYRNLAREGHSMPGQFQGLPESHLVHLM